jgi:hypothetical protein
MIKKFEEFSYEEFSYEEVPHDRYSTFADNVPEMREDFTPTEINYLKSIFKPFPNSSFKEIEQIFPYEIYFVIQIQRPELKMNNYTPSDIYGISITKLSDEWFIVDFTNIDHLFRGPVRRSRAERSSLAKHKYKCDQLFGVKQCIKDFTKL